MMWTIFGSYDHLIVVYLVHVFYDQSILFGYHDNIKF